MIVFSNSVLLFSHQKCFSPTLKNLYCIIANGGCINRANAPLNNSSFTILFFHSYY